MAKRLFILDLDRTIFDTHHFFEDIKSALHRTHELDFDEFMRTYQDFIEPGNAGYSPHRHMKHMLGLSTDQLDHLIRTELGNRDYTFSDAARWLAGHHADDIIVMTVGTPRYQALKFHHCHAIKHLRKVVVDTNKGALIRRHLTGSGHEYGLDFLDQPYERIFLIDDGAYTFNELGRTDRITSIRIARPGEKFASEPTPPGVRDIKSFDEIGDL